MSDAMPMRSNPFIGPRAFDRADADHFYGRIAEITDLVYLLIAERIVLLYSPSGAGKTSLLQAGVIPELERRKSRVVPELEQPEFRVMPVMRVSQE